MPPQAQKWPSTEATRSMPSPYRIRFQKYKYILCVSHALINIKIKGFCSHIVKSPKHSFKIKIIFFFHEYISLRRIEKYPFVFSPRGMMVAEFRAYGCYHNSGVSMYFKSWSLGRWYSRYYGIWMSLLFIILRQLFSLLLLSFVLLLLLLLLLIHTRPTSCEVWNSDDGI